MNEIFVEVVSGISQLIRRDLVSLSQEMTHPGSSVDQMEDRIKFHRERAAKLAKLRAEFEELMSQVQP